MAKIPNQNTIVETIRANVDSIEKVIGIIVTSADAVAAIAPASMKNITTYSVTLNTLFAKDGICTVITSAVTNMAKAANAKFNRRAVKRLRHNIFVTINEIKNIVQYLSENGSIDMPKTNFDGFSGLIKAITDVISLANEDTIKLSWFKMLRIKRLIRRIVNSISSMKFDINTAGTGGGADMSNYYTKAQVDAKGYLTSVPSEYVTETEMNNKGYLTSVPSEYITESELNTVLGNLKFITITQTAYDNLSSKDPNTIYIIS